MPSVRSRNVVFPDQIKPATVRFEEGVIVEIGDGPADVDFGDLAILPGLVDAHVHVNEPGRTGWEGFDTATRAAAAGGTTTIVDMPLNSTPPTVDAIALRLKREAVGGQAAVDVAFWGGIIPGSEDSIAALVDDGVCGFKVFLVDSGVPEFPPMKIERLRRVLPGLAGTPLLVHAEDPLRLRPPSGDPRAYATYLATRPGDAEAAAIDSVAPLTEVNPVHVLHVSGIDAVEAIRRQRTRSGLSAETCPHYLTFDAGEIPYGSTAHKCAPPIRTVEDREALWEALADGTLAMIVSDHSPAPPEVKDPREGDFIAAWGGIASVGQRLVATWDGAHRRGHDLMRVAEWLALAPARLAGLGHRKGTISAGYDADFVVFDREGATSIAAGALLQRHPVSPYDGMRLAGSVVATYLAGVQIHGPGAVPGRHGRQLRRGE
jgi:allantoinase